MIGDATKVSDKRPYYATVIMPDSGTISVVQAGTMRVKVYCILNNCHYTLPLTDTLIVPNLRIPLMSAICFAQAGHHISFTGDFVELTMNHEEDNPLQIRLSHPFYHPSANHQTYTIIRHTSHPYANTVHEHLDLPADQEISAITDQTFDEQLNSSFCAYISPDTTATTRTPDTRLNIVPNNYNYNSQSITFEKLHNRPGHVSIKVLLAGWESQVWQPINIQFELDPLCMGCKIGAIHTANHGKGMVSNPAHPGQVLHLDTIYNPSKIGLTKASYFPYYLGITDAYLHAYFLVGMQNTDTKALI
jgi:hypothetical protein